MQLKGKINDSITVVLHSVQVTRIQSCIAKRCHVTLQQPTLKHPRNC